MVPDAQVYLWIWHVTLSFNSVEGKPTSLPPPLPGGLPVTMLYVPDPTAEGDIGTSINPFFCM